MMWAAGQGGKASSHQAPSAVACHGKALPVANGYLAALARSPWRYDASMELILYSTGACTLCEQALDLLLSMPELSGLALRVVDVATEDALLQRYGERIPVLRFASREIDSPFDRDAVIGLLGPSVLLDEQ